MSASFPSSFQAPAAPPIEIDEALNILNTLKGNQRKQKALQLEQAKTQALMNQAGFDLNQDGTVTKMPKSVLDAEAVALAQRGAQAQVAGEEVLQKVEADRRGEALRALQAVTGGQEAPNVPMPTGGMLGGLQSTLEKETGVPRPGAGPVLDNVRQASILSAFFSLPEAQQQAALSDPGVASFLQGEAVDPGGRSRSLRRSEAQTKAAEQSVAMNEMQIQLSQAKADVAGKVQRGEQLTAADYAMLTDSPQALAQMLPKDSPIRQEADLRLKRERKSIEFMDAQIAQMTNKLKKKPGFGNLFTEEGQAKFTTIGQLLKGEIEQAGIDLDDLDATSLWASLGVRSDMAKLNDVVRRVKSRAEELGVEDNLTKVMLEETIGKQVREAIDEIGVIEEQFDDIPGALAKFGTQGVPWAVPTLGIPSIQETPDRLTEKQQVKLIGEGILFEIETLGIPPKPSSE